ncbi:hypothetical protein HMPREF0765_2608 [Sphingobacterium spiritivorum ATCC 33300]|uniref:DUF4286 domain-containing protein n=1 Tax=Sphingobacterium spiritivorum ATCC 33300 TaxID=525372 RepID=C2FZ52_SPHSI|nr:DUF4286 family protein [Sphingobacterium spiritivorum]EEI91894.1 hypothetical protein HMPREF0765_2608 [Sphingobacterium spiritivorum ATCC 33300]QQS96966.1 DUF4286 family protein [Sphingobacterium spiritivorum]
MYLYNISIITEDSVHAEIMDWVKTGILSQSEYPAKFLKLLNSPHEGQTHCIQLVVEKEQDIETFNAKYLAPFQEFISTSHHGKAFIFDSIMKYL